VSPILGIKMLKDEFEFVGYFGDLLGLKGLLD